MVFGIKSTNRKLLMVMIHETIMNKVFISRWVIDEKLREGNKFSKICHITIRVYLQVT